MEWDFGGTIINSPGSEPLCSNFGESFMLSLIMNHDPSLPLSLSKYQSSTTYLRTWKKVVLSYSHLHQEVQCVLFIFWREKEPMALFLHLVMKFMEKYYWHMTMKTRYDIHLKLLCWFFLTWASLDSNVSLIGSSIFKLHVTSSVTPDMFNKRNTWKKLFLLTLSSWRDVYLWGQKWLIAPNNWCKL